MALNRCLTAARSCRDPGGLPLGETCGNLLTCDDSRVTIRPALGLGMRFGSGPAPRCGFIAAPQHDARWVARYSLKDRKVSSRRKPI